MPKLKKLHFVFLSEPDEDLGEAEAVFSADGQLLGCWSCNDAHWRQEYFGPFMRVLGFETVSRNPTPKELKQMREAFGFTTSTKGEA